MIGIGISTKDNNSSDDNSVSSVDDIEGDFTYTATPTSIIDDLSIPGAFAQRLQCSNKRCCNDTECSNYRDIDIGDALMIGGGRRSKYASSYDGKSPEEIRKVKKARKAALEKARKMNQSQQKADEEKAKDRARKKTPQNKENDRFRKKTDKEKEKDRARKKTPFTKITHHCILKDTLGGIYSIFVGYHTSSIFSVQARNQL